MVYTELDEIGCNANCLHEFAKSYLFDLLLHTKQVFPLTPIYVCLARLPETHNKPEDVPTMLLILYLHVS